MRWGAPCAVVSIAVALQCRIAKRMGRVFLNGGLSAHRVLALSDEGELEWSEPGTEERAAPGWKAAMDRRHPGHNAA